MTIGSSIRAAATWALVRVRRVPWLHKPVHAIAVLIVRTSLGARWVKAVLEPEYPTVSSYEGWVAAYDTLSAEDRKAITAHIARMTRRPLISVVMPTYDTPEPLLTAAIESIRAQLYTDWELCIADDASPSPHVWKVLSRYAAKDARIKVTRRKVNGHICAATNSALALASGEFVALMDHDDLLPERALYEVAAVLDSHPDADLIYSDEDKVDGEGRRFEPHFKTDWNPELLLGQNMVSHLGVYRRTLVEAAGGLREGFEGSQDYDLALRISELTTPARIHHIPWILYHWRQQSKKESFSEANMNRCADAAFRAVSEHLARTGQTDAVVAGQPRAPGWLHVRRRPPVPNPLVSVIVPTRDRSELLGRCLEGVLQGTDYRNIEVIVVDNGSVEPETRALFATLSEDRRVRVVHAPGPFNYSALNNQAAELARGEVLLLLNNDISVIEPDWLGEMVAHAMRPNVGAVGARLLFPDGRLQHGGVILGIGAGTPVAGHAGYLAHGDDGGYYGHLMTPRNVSAVTGACLAMRKAIFHEVGGLDAEHLKVAFNDVDLCLKIRARGYDIVWTPFAELYHHESASRGLDLKGEALERFQREITTMRERWGPVLDNDPFYGHAFSKRHGDYRLADPPPRLAPGDAWNPSTFCALTQTGWILGRSLNGKGEPSSMEATVTVADDGSRLRAIFNSAVDLAIIGTDLEGRVTDWNSGAERLLGWEAGAMIGRLLDVIFPAEDLALNVPGVERARAAADGRGETEGWRLRQDGSRFWALGETFPVRSAAGAHIGFLKILRNRTAAKAAAEAAEATERRLQVSEERLALALSASGLVGTWDWDLATDLVYADRNFAKLYSIDPARSAVGAPFGDYLKNFHPDDVAGFEAELARLFAGADEFVSEYRVLQPDGSIRHVIARGRLVRDAQGAPVRFPGATVDVTDMRQIEQTLRVTQRAAGVGTFEVMPDNMTVQGSEEMYRLFGLSPRSGYQPASLFIETVLPEDRFKVVEDGRLTVEGAMGDVEYRIRRASDGEVRWIGRRGQAVGDGRARRVLGVVQDITERKLAEENLRRSENLFRTFAQALPSHVWTSPPDGMLDWFNDRVYEFSGAGPGDLDGVGWTAMVHPEDLPAASVRWATALTSGEPYETEFRLRDAEGRYRWHIARAVPIRDGDGVITRWIGANTDIDDQRAAAQVLADMNAALGARVEERTAELMQAEEALRQSQKMEAVGQLTGGIAHDFNNLLQGITGSLDLVQKRIAQGRLSELDRFINGAITSANRAAALTHRLLAFSRRQPLDPRPVHANPLVMSMEDLLRRTLGETIRLDLSLGSDLWPTLCDPNQLESAILNLAINARDAMPEGGELTIETSNARLEGGRQDVRAGDYVCVSVRDTGVGMNAATLARAFEPFFTTKPLGHGTGLGLSMIYGFARQSEGQVTIDSQEGAGATFRLYLPRHHGEEPDEAGVAEEVTAQVAEHGETVLVVEDEPVVRGLIIEVLQELGYAAIEAADGQQGVEILQSSRRIDLLVTDIGLPGLNGRQVADAGRALRPNLKVLFLTGYAANASLASGFLEPGMAMLTKPFAMDALGAAIGEILEGDVDHKAT